MKTFVISLMTASVFGVASFIARGAEPRGDGNGWDPSLFAYDRPARMAVEVTTPTPAQIALFPRPPRMPTDALDPVATEGRVAPATLGSVNIWRLRFKDATGQIVPALLCEPKESKGPFPVVIAIHGLTSDKAQVCWQVAGPLAEKGFAVLALDLPCHGERTGDPRAMVDPTRHFTLWRDAVIAVHQLIDYAGSRPELRTEPGVALVGYSLGSWISSVAGPSDDRVKTMVLMVGGAVNLPPALTRDPKVAATDPRVALPHFAGRPLLLLNGKEDTIVRPEMARLLFASAEEPKAQIWFDGGHLLPGQAYQKAAAWLASQKWESRERDGSKSAVPRAEK